MHAINPVYYQHEIEELICKLMKIDPMRKGYYKDLSKIVFLLTFFPICFQNQNVFQLSDCFPNCYGNK